VMAFGVLVKRMQGASQTAAEMGKRSGVINCRGTETGEIATSVVLPEPMSAVRHVSSRGHGVFNMRANRTGHRCLCGCPV